MFFFAFFYFKLNTDINVAPTKLCFPHKIRQSAFTARWRLTPISPPDLRRRRAVETLPLLQDDFVLADGYETIINTGAHFNIRSGTYTAEFPGLYAFFLSFRIINEDTAPMRVKRYTGDIVQETYSMVITRNGVAVAEARTDVSVLHMATMDRLISERASTAVVLDLDAGDIIQLKQPANTPILFPFASDDEMLIFTGFLL